METTGRIIGVRKYEALKSFDLENLDEKNLKLFDIQFPNLTVAEALKMIQAYESRNDHVDESESLKRTTEYFESIYETKPQKEIPVLTKEVLWMMFNKNFRLANGVSYSKDYDSLENIKPLIFYFIGNQDNFLKCKNVSLKSEPSLSKGLLIIGGYGNGKTSVMRALEQSLKRTNVSFRMYSANEVVEMYEACQSIHDKDEFWSNMNKGTICFDDVLTEREANNYGKVNLFKDILERRYELGKRTYLTINFKDGTGNDLDEGIAQLGERYGSRVYDRIFAMFNIIVFTGKSHRK